MRILFLLVLSVPWIVTAQVTSSNQKAFNNCLDYANQSAEEVTSMVNAMATYYPTLGQKRNWGAPRFVTPVQLDTYYYDKALKEGPLSSAPVMSALKELHSTVELLDKKCKELDTYHKLEDYKADNFAKAFALIKDFERLLPDYHSKHNQLRKAVEQHFTKLNPSGNYAKADNLMRKQLDREREFVDRWKLNLKEETATPWIIEELEKDILLTDEAVKQLRAYKPVLNYPASSMWPSFIEALESILEAKRNALDGYNHEARKSDKYPNDVYLSLINYYNGGLMSDYNAFIGFAQGDKYYGIKYTRYTPLFEIRENAAHQANVVQPFNDVPSVALKVLPSKTPIPAGVFRSLGNSIDYIHETSRTVSHLLDVMRNLNSSAAYYKGLTSYTGHGGLSFTHDDFTIPTSYYQKCVTESKSLSTYAPPLNQQAEVILNMLKEMDQLGIAIENEVKTRAYEKDKLMQLYRWIERFAVLYDTWDRKKEELYSNVRVVYDSYPQVTPSSSWVISGKVLHVLTDLDREGLFKAKSFYKTGDPKTIPTDQIDATLREVIANEFTNMKGIEKYGRNHGLCPYTPYEDLPVTSRSLSEDFKNLKPAKKNENGYNHPYHGMVYLYNDIVEDYNKFAELAKVPLLQTVKQPELFFVAYPEPKGVQPDDFPLVKEIPAQSTVPEKPKQQVQNVPPGENGNRSTKKKAQTMEQSNTTVVIHDTVYIERRDTIWMATPPDDLRSMEGYATNNMVLLLDVSGSMNSPEKLPLLKKSVLNMLSMMRKQDEIAIVVFSGKSKVLLNPSSFKDGDKIRKAIESLSSSGKTDGNAGLKLAYKVADENYIRGGNNRIILATDGEFPLGEETTAMIKKFSNEDIHLTVFNFGKGMGSSRALEHLASLGKGNYVAVNEANVELGLIREAKGGKELGR